MQGDDTAKAFTNLFHDLKEAADDAAQPGTRAKQTVIDPNGLRQALTMRGFLKGELLNSLGVLY
jgi:hypothetical protein